MCVKPDFFVSRKYILIIVRAIVARCEWKSAHERFEDSRNRNGIRSRDDYPRIHVLDTTRRNEMAIIGGSSNRRTRCRDFPKSRA